jgi:hypothetical protein
MVRPCSYPASEKLNCHTGPSLSYPSLIFSCTMPTPSLRFSLPWIVEEITEDFWMGVKGQALGYYEDDRGMAWRAPDDRTHH